jgi:hypothetical protein
MIAANRSRETAVVIRRDGKRVSLVVMRAGSLSVLKLSEQAFRADWKELPYELERALERFLLHAQTHGATHEAMKGLQMLKERDRHMAGTLF